MGKIDIKNKIFLAPMAGYTDQAFRVLCFRKGVDIAYSEMVSAKAMKYNDKKTLELLEISDEEKDVGVQLFGSEAEILGQATKTLDRIDKIKVIDLNLGCPAPKIFKNGEGSALLAYPEKIYKLLSEMRRNTDKSLSAKIRIGINDKNNYLEVSKAIEEAGVDFLIVHGRTREQYYSGAADWETIGEIKQHISIPVIGNGDINFDSNVKNILEEYKVDGLMIGRGAVGCPWIFEKINSVYNGNEDFTFNLDDRFNTMIEHIDLICKYKDEKIAIPEMRKNLHAYLKGLKDSAKLKKTINTIKTKNEMKSILLSYREELLTYKE